MNEPKQLGKYEITGTIGRGSMGVVYKAHDPHIDRAVALKTVKQDHLDSREAEEIILRFKREAQAAGRLNHPNIVTVYEFGDDNGIAFIAMEYVDGRTLKEAISANERFTLQTTVKIIRGILAGLAYAHKKGVVHRDIKPDNIMLLKDGGIKITDFGIARIESSELTRHGDLMGTPAYMSPEQCTGTPVDSRSDLFSTGAILYHLLTGEKPFPGENMTTIMHRVVRDTPIIPSELNVTISPALDNCVFKALEKNPAGRFQNAEEFLAALREHSEAAEAAFHPPLSSAADRTVLKAAAAVGQKRKQNLRARLSSRLASPALPIRLGLAATALCLISIAVWMVLKGPAAPEEEIVLQPTGVKNERLHRDAQESSGQGSQGNTRIGIGSKPLDSRKTEEIPYQERQRGIRPRTN